LEVEVQDSLKIIGYWWLPASEDNKLPGILTFSQDEGAVLETIGMFGTDQADQPVLIHGIDEHGHPITLSNCIIHSYNHPIIGSGVGNQKYWVHMIFEGVHFPSEAQIKFYKLYGYYTDLDAWVDINGFEIEQNLIDGKLISRISYEQPPNLLIDIDDNFQVGVGFSYNGPNLSFVQTEVKITQETYLVVGTKNCDIDFECLFEKLNIFSYLLQVATQRIPYPILIIGLSHVNSQEINGEEKYNPKIKIYYQPIEPIRKQKPLIPPLMLFTYKDLDAEQIKKWFSSFEFYKTQIHLYRALFFNNRLFLETKFLNIAQALESLHGILYGSQYLSNDDFKKKKELALESVPDEYKVWVERALTSTNYKSFKIRIYELLKRKEQLFSVCINDFENFSKRVRDTRNEFVHQGKQKNSFHSKEEIFSSTKLLSIVFEVYLLEIMGFPDEKIAKIYKQQIDQYLQFGVKF
jgi:hypothetical protein